MKTQMTQNGDVTVVVVSGRLDIDQTGSFKQACFSHLSKKKVVFQLSELTFVGSTGIQSFFQILQELHSKTPFGVRIVGLHQDFQRLFQLRPEGPSAPCLNHIQEAILSFQMPQMIEAENKITVPQIEASGASVSDSTRMV